jgi:uncharacterized protein
MELVLDVGQALYHIQRYQDRRIVVNGQSYAYPIVVLPDHLITPWAVESFEALCAKDFDCLLAFAPKIVLLGTGQTTQFPSDRVFETLIAQGIAFEVMNTRAACGAYTLLMGEGTKVAAALLN